MRPPTLERAPAPEAAAARPATAPAPARASAALLAGLFAAAALIAGFTLLRGIDPFDEGLALQAARRVAGGQMPYRDFLWAYGPANPYLLGFSFDLFGVSLLGWRVLRVGLAAAVAVAVFVLARREAGPRAAAVAFLVAACAMAQPASANPFPAALLLDLLAVAALTAGPATARRALGAGALIGLAAAWRLDFALYGAAACTLVLLLGPERPAERARRAGTLAAAALAAGLAVHAPFLAAIGPAALYEALVGTSLRTGDFWSLPFPLLYDGPLRPWPPGALASDLRDWLAFELPLLAVAGAVLAAAAAVWRWRAEGRPPAAWAGLLLLAGGGLSYLLSRTDEFHLTPLVVVLAVLLPAVAAWARRRPARGAAPLAAAAAALLGLLALNGVADRLSALLLPKPLAPLAAPAADGVRAPPAEARALDRVVAVVRRRVPPGEPIYVATRRSDLVTLSNPLVYVLTERDNPTRRDFGLLAAPAAQRSIVATLRRARPRVVVRWLDPASARPEPNLRGRPSGSRLLDEHLAAAYRPLERAGAYELLVRR